MISLRSALDSSREELRRLREIVGDFNGESYADAVERLSLENHVLRRRILDDRRENRIESSPNDVASSRNASPSAAKQSAAQERHSISVDNVSQRGVEEPEEKQ